MKYWLYMIPGFCMLLCLDAFSGTPSGDNLPWPEVVLSSEDRILILAPHPDDEALACGGIIQKAVAKGLPIRIVFLTYGDNNEWSFILYRKHPVVRAKAVQKMGLIRHDEAIAADKLLGVSADKLTFLGYPDFRTLNIWYTHWANEPSCISMFTHVNKVPYTNALHPGAPYKGEEILKDLKFILQEFKPTKIFLSHPGDHNVDHRSLYLFTRVALWDLEKEMKPDLYPYLVHFKNWPRPRGYYPDKTLEPPLFFRNQVSWEINHLNSEQTNIKENALKAHHTQYESSGKYLSSFVRINELYGDFPDVVLIPSTSTLSLSPEHTEDLLEPPEELIDREINSFVGIEERYIQLKDNHIELSIKFSRPLAKEAGISVHIFGYRVDRAFAEMPKLHIKLGEIGHSVYDQSRVLSLDSIHINRDKRKVTMRIPLELLGNPQRIMTSARSYLGDVPLDWVSWRILNLSEGK